MDATLLHPISIDDMITNKPSSLIKSTVLAIAFLAAGCGGGSADEALSSAKDYLAKNDPAAATIQLKNALAKNPNLAEARFLLGRALLDSGDAVAAEVELRKAIDLKFAAEQVTPVLARALLSQGQHQKILDELAGSPTASPTGLADLKTTIGVSLAVQGKAEAARTAFNEAIAANNDYAPAHLALARLKVQEQDVAGAQSIIDNILDKSPTNADAWHFKADLLRAKGKSDEAIAAYQKVIEIKPRAVTAHTALVVTHLANQKIDLASKQLKAMQQAAPKHPLTLYTTGLFAYTNKDIPTASSAVDDLLKVQPNSPLGLMLAGVIAYENRSDILAQEYLAKALHLAPGLDFGRRTLVMSQMRSGHPTKALETLQPVLQGDETSAQWLALAGEAYMQSGDAKKAEEFFSRAAKSDPKSIKLQTSLALARMRTGQADQALADLAQIAESDSGTSADMVLIASTLQQKQFDKALKAIANLEKKNPDNPLPHTLRGDALVLKGDIAGARKSLEKALSINPTYLPAANSLARIDLLEKRPDQARQRFEAVLLNDPKNVQAMLALTELRIQEGANVEEITTLINKAIAAAPNDAAPRLALIAAYIRAKDNKKALTAVQEALAAVPDRPEVLDVAGRVFQLTGDTNQALATYGKLATLLPTAPHPYLRMAEIQLAANNKDGARSSLAKGLTLLPDSLPMQRAQIMLDIIDEQFDAALARAHDIQKLHPKEIAGYVLEGDIHIARKAWNQAVAAYRTALKITPSTELAGRLYSILMLGGQSSDASKFADGWLKDYPKDNTFRLFLADAANKRKDYAAAAAQYRTVLAQAPDNPALLNNLAWSLGQMKDPKALGYAEQANKLAPNQPAIMDTLGGLLIEQGNVERALDLLEKAVALAPQAAEVRLSYAKALLKAGKKPLAKQELETLAKLGERFPAQTEVATLLKGL